MAWKIRKVRINGKEAEIEMEDDDDILSLQQEVIKLQGELHELAGPDKKAKKEEIEKTEEELKAKIKEKVKDEPTLWDYLFGSGE
jgi:hypothetical protein